MEEKVAIGSASVYSQSATISFSLTKGRKACHIFKPNKPEEGCYMIGMIYSETSDKKTVPIIKGPANMFA